MRDGKSTTEQGWEKEAARASSTLNTESSGTIHQQRRNDGEEAARVDMSEVQRRNEEYSSGDEEYEPTTPPSRRSPVDLSNEDEGTGKESLFPPKKKLRIV